MDTDLVTRAQRGDEEAFALLAPSRRSAPCGGAQDPARPRPRRGRDAAGAARHLAGPPAAPRPGALRGLVVPAPRARLLRRGSPRNVAGRPTCTCFPPMRRCGGWVERGRRSRSARARFPAALHRSSRGGGAAPLPRPAARAGCRHCSASRSGRPTHDFITRCAGCARRSTPTHGPRRRRLPNEHRSRHHAHRPVVAEDR